MPEMLFGEPIQPHLTPKRGPANAQALGDMPVSKDLLVYSRKEFQRWKEALNHVVANAVREGRLLYGNP